jgi:hypothetical protein
MFWRKRARLHADEFKKTWFGAASKNGFRIELRRPYYIDYIEGSKHYSIFFEPKGLRHGLIVYHRDTTGLENASPQRVQSVVANVVRALEFLEWEIDLVPAVETATTTNSSCDEA